MLFNQSSLLFASLTLIVPVLQECKFDVDTDVDIDVETDDGDVDVDVNIEVDVDVDINEEDGADGGDHGGQDPKCDPHDGVKMVPIKTLPGLKKVVIWERTGGTSPTPIEFDPDSQALKTRLNGPLTTNNNDYETSADEFCDVFYSDKWGNPYAWGSWLAIECEFEAKAPAGGGLNVARVDLEFFGGKIESADRLGKVAGFGDNYIPEDNDNAIDMGPNSLQTHTTLGNTAGTMERLLLVVGFESSVEPKCEEDPHQY